MHETDDSAAKQPWWSWPRRLIRLLSLVVVCLFIAWIGVSLFGGVPARLQNQSTQSPSAAVTNHDPEKSAWPVTISSPLGDTTISKEPDRLVAVDPESADALLALGVTPVGMPDMSGSTTNGAAITPWVANSLSIQKPELLQKSTTSLPYDQITALKPDVIVAIGAHLHQDQFATLSRIAPTVAYPTAPDTTSWAETTRIVGAIVGKTKQAEKLINDTAASLDKARGEHPEFFGKTVGVTSATSETGLTYYFGGNQSVRLLRSLGFTPLPAAEVLALSGPTGRDYQLVPWDSVSRLNPDVLLTWYKNDEMQGHTENNHEFSSLRAVTTGHYMPIKDPTLQLAFSHPSVLNISWQLPIIVPRLAKLLRTPATPTSTTATVPQHNGSQETSPTPSDSTDETAVTPSGARH